MNYEAILNKNHNNTFLKLKYGFEKKDTNLPTFKNSIKSNKTYQLGDKQKLEKLLKVDTKELIKISIPNSFALQTTFTLQAPYYSSDDDEFYIINNPCLKEKVFKVPMMRGSGWKGALLSSARELVKGYEELESYFRLFGVGGEAFENVVDKVNDDDFKLFFMLNGLIIDVNEDVKSIFKKYKKSKAAKGRAIFYATYFDKLSLEIINPHNRKTKAGTNPIHYEVVPKGTTSELQIVYIPFDAVLESKEKIEKEAKADLEFLKNCINKALNNGIGAKTKLGWGKSQDIKIECFWSDKNECK
ncbi:hypothetical protein KKC13_11530 [bacterium]|nr:hypothetical protein [bacterium]MBU1957916.1 hypothetical protein [bacterium]